MNQIRDLLLFSRGLNRMKRLNETNRTRRRIGEVMFDQKPPARLRRKKCVPVRKTNRILLLVERVQKNESILKRRKIEPILLED
jgi:hypothetical protein